MRKTEILRFEKWSLWSITPDMKKWWLTYHSITKNGIEVYKSFLSGRVTSEVFKQWEKLTNLTYNKELSSKLERAVYTKNQIDFTSAKMKQGKDFFLDVLIPLTEYEQITKERGTWNWQFDYYAKGGISDFIPIQNIVS